MKVTVKNGKPCERILKIELDSAAVRKEYDEFYRSIASKAKVPGFRPGKAPQSVLAMHYKDEARKEVLNHLISESFHAAIKEQVLEPLGYPVIQEVDFSEERLSYQATIEIRPKIKLSKVTGLKADKKEEPVKPEEIEESLRRLQKSQAQYKPVEGRALQMGDIAIIDYTCSVEGKEIDKRNDDWIPLQAEEYLKGFSAQLTGLEPGLEKEIRINLPENFGRKEWAGKEAVFKVNLKEIKTEELPPLDDELAKSAGEFKNLEELKEKIRTDITQAKTRAAETAYEKALLDELLKQNKVDLPEGMVARRLERLVEDALANYKRHGASEEELQARGEELKKNLEPEARRQVHVAFLLDEIASKENLTASEADLKVRYEQYAAQIRQPVETIEKYYKEHEEARLALSDQVRNEKAIEFIKTNAKQK